MVYFLNVCFYLFTSYRSIYRNLKIQQIKYRLLFSAGESVDISDGDAESMALTESSSQTLREKLIYKSGDSHHNQGHHGKISTRVVPMDYGIVHRDG